ncbi:hypothetical protein PVK06_008301 [Gossypium arboreum]|uniref:Uncharacterized protein n=1 Tax=Gossypium arboreum TaxID=29729 RepID=A0ABR0QJT7_GOSAR|nr:hypothetical protein PVK06_008301 [Gossypium arboreum]
MLNLAKFFNNDPLIIKEGEVDDVTAFIAIEAWEHSDFLCRNYILNGLSDALYEVYSVKNMAKELWTSLDHKYKTEDAGAKKFLVTKFLNFVMVAAIIEKLPLTWNDFKNYLKYKRKKVSMEDLIVKLQIEEDNRGTGKNINKTTDVNGAKTNVVEVKKEFKKGKQPQNRSKLRPKGGVSKKQKFSREMLQLKQDGQ